ncbi:RNA polymerase sigma factor [Cellulosilyticum sp. I15G10I2]|uniref:RNA polymerase sigma factor n=1 Tax=Cellulosilyticum sp. I15G10I2 TaxID=1892843 RepID=UPI001FA72E16|nr:sigma factor [Cellulosilyticum sp. I15G10I2]
MDRKTLFTNDDVLKRYSDMVYKLALSQCKNPTNADDIFQEVFLQYVKSTVEFESDEHIKHGL